MTYTQVQKLVKIKTDPLFPDYKGKAVGGGNIYHTKKTETGKNIIFQSILNYHVFPIGCLLRIENNSITLHYQKVFSAPLNKDSNPRFFIHALKSPQSNSFKISTGADVDRWIEILQEELEDHRC